MALEWPYLHLDPANGARFGYLRVRDGKPRNARRNVSLTAAARAVLVRRYQETESPRVFNSDAGNKPLSIFTLDDQHARLREALSLPHDFVIHSLRHTLLTRLGEAGADAFTIMRISGHSIVTVSQRYVHPSPASLERAFECLDNDEREGYQGAAKGVMQLVPTNPPTGTEAPQSLPS